MDNEQRLKELERRRRRGARLLEAGVAPAEVARRVGVSRQAAWRWEQLRQAGGLEALRRPKHFGRPRRPCGRGSSRWRPSAVGSAIGASMRCRVARASR